MPDITQSLKDEIRMVALQIGFGGQDWTRLAEELNSRGITTTRSRAFTGTNLRKFCLRNEIDFTQPSERGPTPKSAENRSEIRYAEGRGVRLSAADASFKDRTRNEPEPSIGEILSQEVARAKAAESHRRDSVGYIDKLVELAITLVTELDHIVGESGTKESLVLPFIQALGFDTDDHDEVSPAYSLEADSDELVADYTIIRHGTTSVVFECRAHRESLVEQDESRIADYLRASPNTEIGVLTNGLEYRFFSRSPAKPETDIDRLFSLDLLRLDPQGNEVMLLRHLTKENFNVGTLKTEMRFLAAGLPQWLFVQHETLKDIVDWWNSRESFAMDVHDRRPIFSGKSRNSGIRVNELILRRAMEKAKRDRIRTGGNLSQLVEWLLWLYIGSPTDVIEDADPS